MDEALARSADQERQAEAAPGVEPGDADQALLRRLAEADAGIEHDALARDAGARGDFERAREELGDVGDNVDGWIGGIAIVHDDDGRIVLGDDARHVGVALQPPHVVDDRGAGLERPGRHGGLHRVDRDRNAEPDHGRQDAGKARCAPPRAAPQPHRHRAASIPRRYRECRRLRRPGACAWAMAAAGSRKRPPSENESGVTLRTPMTSGRFFARRSRNTLAAARQIGRLQACENCNLRPFPGPSLSRPWRRLAAYRMVVALRGREKRVKPRTGSTKGRDGRADQ